MSCAIPVPRPKRRKRRKKKRDAWDKQLAAAAGPIFDSIMKLMADKSGYEEIARAPVLFISHSMGGLLCYSAPYRIRDRVWGSIPFKTGVRGIPNDIPDANMHGVPMMYVNQVAIEGPAGHSDPNNSCIGLRKDPENLICQLYDWGSHHLETTREPRSHGGDVHREGIGIMIVEELTRGREGGASQARGTQQTGETFQHGGIVVNQEYGGCWVAHRCSFRATGNVKEKVAPRRDC